ncbi:hypothetical protein OS493_028496 [Desmophyllum pertusum]|uniref:Ig-like domain-containing protein n=1 Tax=Desmophyllum pertusum TaxID=174260 RepID=A0A9W9ZBH4_9CNID|nr:hypothetical protein OS493_028496 [Desmophyllum pertusum]
MIICVWNLLFVYNILVPVASSGCEAGSFLHNSDSSVPTRKPRRELENEDLENGVGALKFLSYPPFAMIGYMGMNADINCSTNDPNATVTLLHQASFTTWVEKTVTPNELILTGQVFKLLSLVVSDGGRYNCKATDGTNTIRWPTYKGMLVLKPGSLPSYFELVPKKPIIVLQGKGGQITCEAEGYTVSKLTWKKTN